MFNSESMRRAYIAYKKEQNMRPQRTPFDIKKIDLSKYLGIWY